MLKKFFSRSAGLLLVSAFLCSQVQAASPVWKIEQGHNVTYLAGTIHVLRKADYPLPAAFDQAYQASQVVTFEVDIADSRTPEFNQAMLQVMLLPQGENLQQYLKPDTYQKLQQYVQQQKLNMNQFSGFKPSMLAITLTMLELQKMGVGDQGVDEHFYTRAIQQGKSVQALESIQDQLNFISQMGEGMEDEMILQTLADIASLQSQFGEMIQSWRSGDTKALEELFVDPMRKDFEPVYQQLLVQRNQNWMPQIRHYLQTSETEMVLVGSAHLLGPDGLLEQLKKAGYRISQLD
jgi:uncharacterized protein